MKDKIESLLTSGQEDNLKLGFELIKTFDLYSLLKPYEVIQKICGFYKLEQVFLRETLVIRKYINKIKIPAQLSKLRNVQKLEFKDSNIEFEETFVCPPNLQSLKFINCAPSFKKLENCDKLEVITLSKIAMLKLPQFIFQCVNLQRLRVYNLPITELDSRVGELKQLEVLNIQDTNVNKIHESVFKLPKLRTVIFQFGLLEKLPENVYTCESLRRLVIYSTNLSYIDPKILNLPRLDTLSIARNMVKAISTDGKVARDRKIALKLQLDSNTLLCPEILQNLFIDVQILHNTL